MSRIQWDNPCKCAVMCSIKYEVSFEIFLRSIDYKSSFSISLQFILKQVVLSHPPFEWAT